MTDICFDDDVIESLRKSSIHKKFIKCDNDRGRIFIVRKGGQGKNCDNNLDLKSSPCKSNAPDKSRKKSPPREMSCGDHAQPSKKTCQLQITQPIICTISSPENAQAKGSRSTCAAKLNVKRKSKVKLSIPGKGKTTVQCTCCCKPSSMKVNIARKLMGPYPDEALLSIVDRVARIFGKIVGQCDSLEVTCCPPPKCKKIF